MNNNNMTHNSADATPVEANLLRQDTFYGSLRKAYAVDSETATRTLRFSAESKQQATTLLSMLLWCTEECWVSPLDTFALRSEAQFTLVPDSLSIAEVRWLFSLVPGSLLAPATLAYASEYTGVEQEACGMERTRPSDAALAQSSLSAAKWASKLATDGADVSALSELLTSMTSATHKEREAAFGDPIFQTFPAFNEVSSTTLREQDELYAKRRAPYQTPVGAEGRTFRFRVEFENDLQPLLALIGWAAEKVWRSPVCPWGDADAKVTLKEGSLTLDEVRWLFDIPADCHVAMETVQLSRDYTGGRAYMCAHELGAVMPALDKLSKCLDCLQDYIEHLEHRASLFTEASEKLEEALDQDAAD